jgi:hypothetical protein
MSKDSIYENEYEEFEDSEKGSMRKVLFYLSVASMVILLLCVYLTKSFVYGYVSHVLIMTGLWSMVYIEDLWKELTVKTRVIAVPMSIIFLCSGLTMIGLRTYLVFQGY